MAITAELHDGTRLEFPDGTDPAVIQRTVKSVMSSRAPQETKPAVVSAGEQLRAVPRALGLNARAAIKGVAAIPAMLTDGVGAAYNIAADAMPGDGRGFRFGLTMPALDSLLTKAGLPEPNTPTERVASDIMAMASGTAGTVKAAEKAAALLPGAAKAAAQAMAARPGVQLAGAATAGAAGGSVREAGGGPGEQFVASLAGGLAGGAAADKVGAGVNALARRLTPQPVRLREADLKISLALERSGVDWTQVPERIRQQLRQEVAGALDGGTRLDPAALRRLLAYKATGTTPTVGQLKQDPGLITREKNLAKTGANSTDPRLQQLPALENANTSRLLSLLDEAGAGSGVRPQDASGQAINALSGLEATARGNINALYSAARDSSGRSLPLNHGFFNQRVSQLLDDANVGSFLPADIRNKLNAMASGRPGYGLTVDSAEQLKTSIGKLQRGSNDGNMRAALGLVRQALDETPLADSIRSNIDNLPAVPGAVPPSTAGAGQEAVKAFGAARSANRQWMQQVEANPALRAVVEGVEPDQFFQRYVIGKQASAAEVRDLVGMLNPQARASMKNAVAKYLKDAATGGDDDIIKFGGKSFRDALRAVEDKLPALFSTEEIQQLRSIAAVSKYMQAQPAGSAVNNSNSGALMLGRGLDMLDAAAQKIPFGGRDVITGVLQGMAQREVMTPKNALALMAGPKQRVGQLNPLMAASLLPAPVNGRENDRRN